METGAMLIERIIPGDMLKNEPSLEKRLSVFCDIYEGIHKEPKNIESYVSYQKLLCDAVEFMETLNNKELYAHSLKAKEMYMEMLSVYDEKVLLHWDLHNKNILLDKTGRYKAIDPFGFIGYCVLDVGRYISVECLDVAPENQMEIVHKITDYFEENLRIPKKISKQCFYIDVTINNCWIVKDGFTANMNDVRFAETVLV